MTTPAEARAEREGLPVVLMVPDELARVMEGNPIIVGSLKLTDATLFTRDAQEVLVRLPTVDEAYEMHVQAVNKQRAQGIDLEYADRDMFERIVAPINLRGSADDNHQ